MTARRQTDGALQRACSPRLPSAGLALAQPAAAATRTAAPTAKAKRCSRMRPARRTVVGLLGLVGLIFVIMAITDGDDNDDVPDSP